MLRKSAALLMFLTFVAGVWGQGLNLPPGVTKDDWEEINFEFNSSVLVDGFPSLLRLAELLQMNPGYKVQVNGHTDVIGGTQYNDRLGLARANAVRDFLIKYGAQPGQVTTTSEGKANPRYPGQKDVYEKTDEARYMNRRVSLTVTGEDGRTIGATNGSAGEAIRALAPTAPGPAAGVADCCSEVLKKLDKLDDIAKMLKDLGDQNSDLKKQLNDLKAAQQVLESKVNQPPPVVPPPPTTNEIGKEVAKQIEANKEPKFQMLGMNVGMDDTGNTTFSGKGRYFSPFGEHFALQAQAEYLYFKTDREGQFDLGMVDRLGHFQAGLFASFKHATLTQYQNGGTLGQGAITLDYIFKRGKLGLFGTKGFMSNALVNVANATDPVTGALLNHLFNYSYLSVVDQAGVNATIALLGNTYLEGNVGYLHGQLAGNRVGMTARFVFPLNSHLAFTVEGGLNETLLEPKNSGRAVVGMEFGNMLRPKELLAADHAVPADVPRVRYEVITKQVRNGDDPPVADAGPNQINVPAGLITLNGSGSYSPDGNPITFQWVESVGPAVTLSAPTSAITTFTAVAGQLYTFRLLVKDNFGAQSFAYVTISTKATPTPTINFFTATPASITSGQSSTLSWSVTGANTVTITGNSSTNLGLTGSLPVSPTVTTTYTLTATNSYGSTTSQVTVVVGSSTVSLLYCYATPTNIMAGESATLNWSAPLATAVTISPTVGSVPPTGTFAVSPTATTNYTVMATGPNNTSASCTIAVTVTPGQLPRIIQFSATPPNIMSGQSSTLNWVVDNATAVSINNGVGTVALTGTQSVSPTATTAYTLTATNAYGSVTAMATVTVTVVPPPTITSFTASPSPSTGAGAKVTLTCDTMNATNVNIAGGMFFGANDSLVVFPNTTTTYTCIATNQLGQAVQASVTVVVPPSTAPTGPPPTVVISGGTTITTTNRTLTLNASGSSSPAGNTPLTYYWSIASGNGAGIVGANTATPTVTLGVPDGEYDFQLVVTDSKGNSASAVVRVMLVSTATTN
ncbi:MAG TPA: OmpA family protein [Bryobacteraceae bacterium]|jgi:hypothetical protein